MLGIPFLSTYIQRIVKVQSVADSVDWLNYYCTSLLLAFFALAISAKQYFGSPIQCWVPNEFKGSWERYAEDYCFVANSYFVPLDQEVPRELAHRQDQISYYRWVPIALAIQALFFWLPNWLWNMLHKQTAINPRAMLVEAAKSRALHGAQREKEVEGLAAFLSDTLAVFWEENGRKGRRGRRTPSGLNATLLYLGIKLLYVLNCFGQLAILNRFLGGKYHSWAWESFLGLFRGEEWHESVVFPRQILCDFSVRLLGNNHRHTVQCVIMLNLINEKLYFFLHFWLLLVGIVTLINFFYYLLVLMLGSLRTEFIKRNINRRQQKLRGFGTRELCRFVQSRLRPDGVLLLHFIRQHIGGRVTYELLNELLRLHWMAQNAGATGGGSTSSSTQSGHLSSSNSPNSEKVPEMGRPMNGVGEEELDEGEGAIGEMEDPLFDGYSRQNTYKPTAYGPGALVYPGATPIDRPTYLPPPLAPPPPAFSPASLLRAISGTASPNTLQMATNGGNHYSAPPTLEFIDGQSNGAVKNGGGEVSSASSKARMAMMPKTPPMMNTTPLAHSRRAKSPLVTGLGSIGKRQGSNVGTPRNNNNSDEEYLLLKPATNEGGKTFENGPDKEDSTV